MSVWIADLQPQRPAGGLEFLKADSLPGEIVFHLFQVVGFEENLFDEVHGLRRRRCLQSNDLSAAQLEARNGRVVATDTGIARCEQALVSPARNRQVRNENGHSRNACNLRAFCWLSRYRAGRSEEHTSELQSHSDLVCR